MKVAAPPANEALRTAAVESIVSQLAAQQQSLNALVEVAATAFKVPIVAVGLIDRTTERFVASHGLEQNEVVREFPNFSHVVERGELMVVDDTRVDPRSAHHPMLPSSAGIRFYAGAPIQTDDGLTLGTFWIADFAPRSLSAEHRRLLRAMARLVMDRFDAMNRTSELVAEKATSARLEDRYERLFDAMNEGIVVHDAEGQLIAANRAARELLDLGEFSAGPTLQGRLDVVVLAEDGSIVPTHNRPPHVALRTGRDVRNVVIGVQRKSEPVRWFNVSSLLDRFEAGAAERVLTTLVEISTLKRSHELATSTERQQRMLATRSLAAGVGHEINNPLTIVLSNIEFVQSSLLERGGLTRDSRDALEDARLGAIRVKRIVESLRSLVRERRGNATTDISSLVLEVSIASARDASMPLVHVEGSDRVEVCGDPESLRSIVDRLIENAFEAMAPAHGRDSVTLRIEKRRDGIASISVIDSGRGIPVELRSRVFDPFFTTKPFGTAMGMGLTICESIASSLGGEIAIESNIPRGTIVRVLLPIPA